MEWEKPGSQGSLTPWNGPQAHHKFVFVKPKWFWHLRCSGDGLCALCAGWGSFPGLGWRGRLKTRLQEALENLQICKSPQAVHELVPIGAEGREAAAAQASTAPLQSGTRKAQTRSPPFSCRCVCCTWKKGWRTSCRMLPCAAAQNPGAAAAPRPAPAVLPQPLSRSGLADPPRTPALHRFPSFPW